MNAKLACGEVESLGFPNAEGYFLPNGGFNSFFKARTSWVVPHLDLGKGYFKRLGYG